MLGNSSRKMLVSCDLTHLTVLILSNNFLSHFEENLILVKNVLKVLLNCKGSNQCVNACNLAFPCQKCA